MSDDKQPDPLAVLAATLEGDRWLSAEAAAFLLGQLKMSTFYQIAAAPDFPKAARIGKGRKWRRLELLEYPKLAAWVDHARIGQAGQSAIGAVRRRGSPTR